MAVNNLLSDSSFIDSRELNDISDLVTKFDDSLAVPIRSGTGSGSFTDSAEKRNSSTVIVKTKEGHGSGVFIGDGGYILTNAHVVDDELEFSVTFDSEYYPTRLVRKEVVPDVALIKLLSSSGRGVQIARELPKVGEKLLLSARLLLLNIATPLLKAWFPRFERCRD